MRQNGNTLLIVLILVLIVGGLGYYFYTKNTQVNNTQTAVANTSVFDYGTTPSGASPVGSQTSQEAGPVSSGKISLSVSTPANGATLSSTLVTVTGHTSPNADVFVNDQQTRADASGNFSLKVTLDEGQNGLVVTANDADGNVAEQDISVNIQTF